jgi:hypothetical protein
MNSIQPNIRFLVFVIFTCAASALGQVDNAPTTTSINGLTDDAWAFQFSIQSSFTLSAFQGGLLSAKHHLAPDKAIRIGLGASFNSTDFSGLSLTRYDTTVTGTSTNEGRGNQNFDLRMQYIIYPDPTADVNAFFGIGPLVGFSHSSAERQELPTSSPASYSYTRSDKRTTWSAGLSGLAGVEWFAWRKISFHAEYGASIQYMWTNQRADYSNSNSGSTTISRTTSEYKEKGWAFYYDRFYFGLSVYF